MAFDERSMNGMGIFVAIVEQGSFASAGDILEMSQPGVSRAIARLEARLGVRLFDRTTRTVTLTEDGLRFHSLVTPLLAGLEEAADSTTRGAAVVRGRLRVNIDPSMSRLLSGALIGEFLRTYPEVQLELVTRERLGDLVGEGFDLGLRFGEPPVTHLQAIQVLETRLLTVATPAYLTRHGRPRTPQGLAEHRCIQYRDAELGRLYDWAFHRGRQKLEVSTQGALTVNDVNTLHGCCLAGEGIAQLMALGNEALLADGSLVELFPDWPDERLSLYSLLPPRMQPPAKSRAFVDFVSSRIG
jgi:DNA-binding transcriptional LysR family regulator